METSTEDKTVAILSYLTIFGFIVAVVLHSNKKTKLGAFHLRQMLGLIIASFALSIVSVVLFIVALIPFLGWIISILGWILIGVAGTFLFVCWIIGFIVAIGGKEKPFPLIGAFIQNKLGGVFN
ncbi:MAG: hypothetical protein LBI02_10325 [Opitutaceae bacterium]|nr:hypothetical protein [Opitutaceae bacterium]